MNCRDISTLLRRTRWWGKAAAVGAFFALGLGADAQVTIPAANTNNGSVNDPFGSYFGFERSAMIYTPAEIVGTGSITAVGFYVNSVTSAANAVDVRIYMKERTTTFTATSTYASETSGATLVYGPTTIPSASFIAGAWTTVTLATPFTYTGGANNLEVIIETNFTGSGGETSTAKQFRYATAASNQFYQNWNADTSAPTGNGTRSANRPNIQLTGITVPPCTFGPGSLTNTAFTSNSADFSWSAPSPAPASGYEWEVRTTGAGGSGPTGLITSGSTGAGVTNASTGATLTANTSYNFYVRANCGSGVFSSWSGPLAFYTGYCISTSTGSGSYMSNFSTTGGFTNIANASGAWSATGYGDFTAQSVSQAAGGTVNFSAAFVGTTVGFAIWVDWNNNLQFETGERVYNSAAYISSAASSFAVPGAQAAGNYRMRIRCDFNLQNPVACGNITRGETEDYTFTVSAPPACAAPTSLSVGSITTNSASVSFTGTSVSYNYEVRTSGAAGSGPTGLVASGPGAASPIALGGLSDATTYTVYVQGVCAGPTTSAWSTGATFTTLCNAFNIPYTQDFSTAVAPAMPNCVTTQDVNGPSAPTGFWRTSSTATTGFTVPFAQYAYATAIGGNDWLYTPGLNLTGGTTYRVSYKYATQSFPEAMDVFWGNAANAAAMTNLIVDHGTFSFTTPSTVQYDFTPGTTGVYYIGWHAKSTADQFNLNLDDISVTLAPTCLNPTAVNLTSVGATSVNLNWTCTSCSGTFIVEYGPTGYTPGTGATAGATGTLVTSAGTSGLTISGLSPATAYTFAVRQFCGGVDYSSNGTVNGTTTIDCDAISTTISCGSSQTASWTATGGAWSVSACGFSTPGAERLYKFTAPLSGTYTLNITSVTTGGNYADWFFKPVSAGCGATGWTCIDDNNAVGTDNFTLSAGVEYYILADPESATSTFSQTFQIDCPCKPEGTRTVVPSCGTNQFFLDVNVTSLGTSTDVDITTDFLGDTEPTSVGLGVTQIGPYPSGTSVIVTLVHDGGGSCNQVLSSISYTCPPVNDDCANALPLSCNSTVTGTTVGATSTGSPGFGCANSGDPYVDNGAPGVWYTLQGWDGPMTVILCGSSYDSQMAVVTGSCGAFTCVAGSDDFCSTQSQVSWTGNSATTYYVYVTGWVTASGTFTLSATCGSTNPSCTANGLNLEFQNDANPGEVTWEVLNAGNLVVLSGTNPIPANSIGTQAICLPNGCYRLRVLDSGGDGMTTGGYELRTQGGNERIIDNTNNFSSGSVSAISNNQTFCLPIGTDKLIYSSCDKLDWVNNKFIVASANPTVSAQFGVTNTTSGYEFWFFDPNGSYSYRRFRSHATSDGFGTGATRACHFKVNGWINSVSTPHLPNNVLLNVRVRGRVAGNNLEFGPACQFKLDAALAACPRVKLQDDPANTSDFSCGVSRDFGGASNPNNRIYAAPPQPIPAVASSAVRYQFRFRIPGENICIVRPPQTSARMVLNWTTGTPLECSKTYEVDVRVSLDGGATWCFGPAASSEAAACADTEAWGKVCLVTINPCAAVNGGGNSMVVEGNNTFTMYPNPNRGDQLFLSVSNVEEGVNTVNVDIYDMAGKRVMARTIAVQDGFVNTNMELNGDLAGGLYVVNITAGSKAYTERLVIQP